MKRCHIIARDIITGEYYLHGSGFSFGGVPTTKMLMVRLDGEKEMQPRYVERAAQIDPHGFIRRMNEAANGHR